jgi:hypothetical protein
MTSLPPVDSYERVLRIKGSNKEGPSSVRCSAPLYCCFITGFLALTLGNLFIVRIQRVHILMVRGVPFITIWRRCTLSTKRRRVRRCEKLTLLPCIGLRSQTSQRPAGIYTFLPDLINFRRFSHLYGILGAKQLVWQRHASIAQRYLFWQERNDILAKEYRSFINHHYWGNFMHV